MTVQVGQHTDPRSVSAVQPESLADLLRAAASSPTPGATVPNDIDDPNSSAHAQLLALTSHSLVDLRAQPAALETAGNSLETQLSKLCSRHVGSFVRVHTATSSLPSALDRLDAQLQTLIEDDLPALSQAAHRFPQQTEEPLAAKIRARNLLDQYETSLKDLFDIPRLLMTCARANHPIEALQLGTHMAKIASSNNDGHRSVILKALKRECWTHLIRLREDLLRGLGARGVRLPAARRYVSLLQRLRDVDEAGQGGKDEEQDRLAISPSVTCLSFLRSRWVLVEELGAHETDEDASAFLGSQISAWRDLVGDSCTIALALFSEQIDDQKDEVSALSLISSFGYRAMAKLEQLVTRMLPQLNGSEASLQDAFESLATLHTQLSYSAASLSRQGLDFSDVSQARLVFEQQALRLWTKGVKSGIDNFEQKMTSEAKFSKQLLTGVDDARGYLATPLKTMQDAGDWSVEVARFPPLATLANGLLDAHEALLTFAPLSIGKDAISSFDFSISDMVARSVESFRKVERDVSATSGDVPLERLRTGTQNSGDSDKRRNHEAILALAARMLTVLGSTLIPVIRGLLTETFGTEQSMAPVLETTIKDGLEWAREMDEQWQLMERERKIEAKEQEERRLDAEKERERAEEQRQREEEERVIAERQEYIRQEEDRRKMEAEKAKEEEDADNAMQEHEAQAAVAEQKRKETEIEERRREREEEQRQSEEAGQKHGEAREAEQTRHEEERKPETAGQAVRKSFEEEDLQSPSVSEEHKLKGTQEAEQEYIEEEDKTDREAVDAEREHRGAERIQGREQEAERTLDNRQMEQEKEDREAMQITRDQERHIVQEQNDSQQSDWRSDTRPDDIKAGAGRAEEQVHPAEERARAQDDESSSTHEEASMPRKDSSITEPEIMPEGPESFKMTEQSTRPSPESEVRPQQSEQTPATRRANKLAENLRKRQEQRERAAAAAATKEGAEASTEEGHHE